MVINGKQDAWKGSFNTRIVFKNRFEFFPGSVFRIKE